MSLIDASERSILNERYVLEKIGLKISVQNCLLHNHDMFPAIRVNIDFENELVFNADLKYFKIMESIVGSVEAQMKYQVAAIIQEQIDQNQNEHEKRMNHIHICLQNSIKEKFVQKVKLMRKNTMRLIHDSQLINSRQI
mgnify:CR=1 FL=1